MQRVFAFSYQISIVHFVNHVVVKNMNHEILEEFIVFFFSL